MPLGDQLFRFAARGHARGGHDFLQTLLRHAQPPELSDAICPAACSSVSSCSGSDDTVGSVTFCGTSAWSSASCSVPPSASASVSTSGTPFASPPPASPLPQTSSSTPPAPPFSTS